MSETEKRRELEKERGIGVRGQEGGMSRISFYDVVRER